MRIKDDADRRLRDDLIRKLIDAHPFEVPESLLEQQTQTRLQTFVREMMGQGYDPRSSQHRLGKSARGDEGVRRG